MADSERAQVLTRICSCSGGEVASLELDLSTTIAELKALLDFQSEMQAIGLEVKWRSRGLATVGDAKEMAQRLAENVDLLQRTLN